MKSQDIRQALIQIAERHNRPHYTACVVRDVLNAFHNDLDHPINGEDELPTGVTEIIVAKNRHGKRGVARVRDRLDICRFVSIVEGGMQGGAA